MAYIVDARPRYTVVPGSIEAQQILQSEWGRQPVAFTKEDVGNEAVRLLQTIAEALQQFKLIYEQHGRNPQYPIHPKSEEAQQILQIEWGNMLIFLDSEESYKRAVHELRRAEGAFKKLKARHKKYGIH